MGLWEALTRYFMLGRSEYHFPRIFCFSAKLKCRSLSRSSPQGEPGGFLPRSMPHLIFGRLRSTSASMNGRMFRRTPSFRSGCHPIGCASSDFHRMEMSDASIEIPLEQFDMSLLPQGARQPGTEAFRDAVTAFFQTELRAAAEWVQVGVDQQSIRAAWRGGVSAGEGRRLSGPPAPHSFKQTFAPPPNGSR